MGRRTCPRCGAHDRSHEVKLEVTIRVAGQEVDSGANGVKVCENCAREIRDELIQVVKDARKKG